jgi:xylulokinase
VLHIDGSRVTQDPLMWVHALDLLLERMKEADFPFADVLAVSGSGQQHGSVYLGRGAAEVLGALDPARPIAEQLAASKGFFAVPEAPIWMDSSTRAECDEVEAAMNDGALQVRCVVGRNHLLTAGCWSGGKSG